MCDACRVDELLFERAKEALADYRAIVDVREPAASKEGTEQRYRDAARALGRLTEVNDIRARVDALRKEA